MAKFIKKIARKVKKRYFRGKGFKYPKVKQMYKDVMKLKSMVNAEKEKYTQNISGNFSPTSPLGPTAITNIAEGATHGQRTGTSVKLHGYVLNLRFRQQSSAVAPQYIKFWLVKYKGPRGTAPALSTFLDADFNGDLSYFSNRNPDHMYGYKIICYRKVYIQADTANTEMYKIVKIYGTFPINEHQKYSTTTAISLLYDQMYWIAVSSNGVIGSNTACEIAGDIELSFYDN